MTGIILAIALAYVVLGVLLLNMGLASRFAWWVKALVIVVTCGFFIEVFFASKSLLGWPEPVILPDVAPVSEIPTAARTPASHRYRRDTIRR